LPSIKKRLFQHNPLNAAVGQLWSDRRERVDGLLPMVGRHNPASFSQSTNARDRPMLKSLATLNRFAKKLGALRKAIVSLGS
jgi:hypothetical protein